MSNCNRDVLGYVKKSWIETGIGKFIWNKDLNLQWELRKSIEHGILKLLRQLGYNIYITSALQLANNCQASRRALSCKIERLHHLTSNFFDKTFFFSWNLKGLRAHNTKSYTMKLYYVNKWVKSGPGGF